MTIPGHNSVDGRPLLDLIQRVERLNEEIKAIQDDRKLTFAEAQGAGFNVKAMKRVIRERAMDKDDLDEFEQLVQMYWGAIGR